MSDKRLPGKKLKNPPIENAAAKISLIDLIIEEESRELIPILQRIQQEYGFIPQNLINRVAEKLKISLAEIYGVITFYHCFYTQPRGKNIVRVCRGTACHVGGSDKMVEAVENKLQISCGDTTADMLFTLETVACVGCCSLAPVMVVGEDTWGRLNKNKVVEIIDKIIEKKR